MKSQINKAQMKQHGRNSQYQMKEDKIRNLPEREFRIMLVKMI